jgi:hypothetical protein
MMTAFARNLNSPFALRRPQTFLQCLKYTLDYGVLGLMCDTRETRLDETSFESSAILRDRLYPGRFSLDRFSTESLPAGTQIQRRDMPDRVAARRLRGTLAHLSGGKRVRSKIRPRKHCLQCQARNERMNTL